MSDGNDPEEDQENNYLNKLNSLQNGDSKDSNCKVQQKNNILNVTDRADVVIDENVDTPSDDQLIGYHETQLVETSEANLSIYRKNCKKNQGHKEFIPIGEFTLKHLPEGHRDKDLYDYIKASADLTVRVDVRMVSPNRPEVWPKTNVPYPFNEMKESIKLRTGSGSMELIRKFDGEFNDGHGLGSSRNLNKCWCKKCDGSNSTSNVWWEFDVITATHVVFDKCEDNCTSLRLFYDRDDSPKITIDKVSVFDVSIEHDWCRLKCVTCDKSLGNKLEEIWENYGNFFTKVLEKYIKSRDVVKLTIIVSHPHGCCKMVSVGQWKNQHKVGGYRNKFTYTTCTCPGSSGASVHCVGYRNAGLSTSLVHSGSLMSRLNVSGAGWAY